jgi:peptide/nickel transport system ATP-binding protein
LLRAEGLCLSLSRGGDAVQLLDGLEFEIARGETVGLVGESGSGKSLTALAAMRLEPDGAVLSGRLLFDGRDLLTADEATLCRHRGGGAALVFQEPGSALNPIMRVEDQVAEVFRLHRDLRGAAARRAARAALARVGLAPPVAAAGAWPHQLSGGQRQRAMLAMALAGDPALLIADEPTSALDVLVRRDILELIAALVRERAMALLLIGHDLPMMRRSVRRVLVMFAGRIVEQGFTDEVLTAPAHPYTRALLAASA